jgi:hypothetical protein
MSYVPPHKRGKATVEIDAKDFPSLAGAGAGSAAGAGTGEKYSSKAASVPVTNSRLNVEKKDFTTFVSSRFQRTVPTEYKVVPEIEKPNRDDGWVTVESKPQKKMTSESEWDGFEY